MNVKILSIDTIGLSVRSTNALHRANIHSVGDMLGCSEQSLYEIRNLGKKSIEEIVEKIKEYKRLNQENEVQTFTSDEFLIPEDFEQWIKDVKNQELIAEWLEEKDIRIENLQLLSPKAFNLLMFAGYNYIYQIVFLPIDKIMEISRMDHASALEIERVVACYIREVKDEMFSSFAIRFSGYAKNKMISVDDLMGNYKYHDVILQYIKANNIEIERMNLSTRPKNRLLSNGYRYMSDILFMSRSELNSIPSMGMESVEEIISRVYEYLAQNQTRIMAVINGDESALWDDDNIRKMILNQYTEIGFQGLSLNDIVTRLQLPEKITMVRIKNIIGQLIADGKLEYVDYRCYRIYGKFEDYLDICSDIDERSREFIRRRLRGETLETIAKASSAITASTTCLRGETLETRVKDKNLTRERVRQIVKKGIEKVRNFYFVKTSMELFDEDYFKYLYTTYAFEKKDGTEWLGVPAYVWNYLDLNDVKRGKKDLQTALEDQKGLDIGLRLKIKNYLNRNKLYIDGMWVEKKRGELEKVVVRKLCSRDVSFDEFCCLYNLFLEQEAIPYDKGIYYTEAVYRTRKNHLADARFLLWKQNEQLRYYDIDGRDYAELLDTLNMDSYENVEFSTLKFVRDYPEIMEKYDIHDQYELHNLLRKIVPEGSYHDFHCGRMPQIQFGVFDRDASIFDILLDNAPISMSDLAEKVSEEYGYDPAVVMANYLQNFSAYYYQGIYTIDQKQMSLENRSLLKTALVDDFYYIDEIRKIYCKLIPGSDVEEINPYNLKTMGFSVYSKYVVQNYPSLDAFFYDLLTKEDIIDISVYRNRFAYVQMFSQKYMELKRNLQIVEFEPNKIINFRKLEQAGISRDMIRDFCNRVYDFVPDNVYFSATSIRLAGFESELYDFGFLDWFYANLLVSDNRFSYGVMFGNPILYKGNCNITIKSFEIQLIQKHGCIDTYDLMNELVEKYGCKITERTDVLYKINDTEIYHDKILDRLYANIDLYYKEIEEEGL